MGFLKLFNRPSSLVSPKADCISLFGQVGRTKVCAGLRLINTVKFTVKNSVSYAESQEKNEK